MPNNANFVYLEKIGSISKYYANPTSKRTDVV